MSQSRPYVYQPLVTRREEIRLLHLLPSEDPEARLEGHLESVPLDTNLQFQSLSYVWGQSTIASEPLHIGDCTLEITTNLQDALQSVRAQHVLYPLWCDRICINQDDIQERNHQVYLMRRIYSTAFLVNIWLGPAFSGASVAFPALGQLAVGRSLVALLQTHGTRSSSLIQDLVVVFRYPWWLRLWTIQEALLAKRALVRCGPCVIGLDTIFQAFELLWNQLVHQASPLRQVCGADALQNLTRQLEVTIRRLHVTRSLVLSQPPGQERRFRDDPSKWPMVMHNCAWSEATDARDKVYGTLGLFPSSPLEVDYSLSLRQTYARSTFAMIQHLGNLAVLTQTVSRTSVDNGLPSWVPDWRYPSRLTASLLVFYDYFRAGRHILLDAVILDEEVLQLSAQYVDEIAEVGDLYHDQSSETIKEVLVLLRPIIESWTVLAGIPKPVDASFLDHFTQSNNQHGVNAQGPRPQFTPAPPKKPVASGSPPYHAPQSYRAPLYKDKSYPSPSLDRGTKRKVGNDMPYMPQQSQFAPVYKDAAYVPQRSHYAPLYKDATYLPPYSSPVNPSAGLSTAPRTYDPFSHTYGEAGFPTPGTHIVSERRAKDSGKHYVDGIPSSEAFWRTLCMDIVEDRELRKHRRCKTADSWRVWEWVDWVLGRGEPTETIPQLHWHLTTQLQGKRLVGTKSGYLGLAGRDVQVGDEVWILAGGAYPYVLRKEDASADERAVRCVSTAYVHGLMDGVKGQEELRTIKIV